MTICGRWVFDTETQAGLSIELHDGKVTSVVESERAEEHTYLAPGFFDAQVNGYGGNDYGLPDLNREQISDIIDEMARSGATRHIATIVTSPQERILRNLEVIAETVSSSPELSGAVAGIHLEGPYISDEDGPRGAHNREFARDPDPGELEEWIAASRGLLAIVTLAPERKGSTAFIEKLREAGIVAAIGHTGASPQQIRSAVDAGATMSTHLGNGSHAMLPRLRNYLWEQLAADELHMGLICDGFHIPGSVVKCFVRAKGMERTVLVSDVALYGGMEPGRYHWGSTEVEVHADGHLGVADTPYLAGAGHTLAWSIPRCCEFLDVAVPEVVRLCTTNPARLFGIPFSERRPQVGDTADFVQFRYLPGDRYLDIGSVVRGIYER